MAVEQVTSRDDQVALFRNRYRNNLVWNNRGGTTRISGYNNFGGFFYARGSTFLHSGVIYEITEVNESIDHNFFTSTSRRPNGFNTVPVYFDPTKSGNKFFTGQYGADNPASTTDVSIVDYATYYLSGSNLSGRWLTGPFQNKDYTSPEYITTQNSSGYPSITHSHMPYGGIIHYTLNYTGSNTARKTYVRTRLSCTGVLESADIELYKIDTIDGQLTHETGHLVTVPEGSVIELESSNGFARAVTNIFRRPL